MMKRIVRREEDLAEWLIDRSWHKGGAENEAGWEGWLLNHWPKWLTFGWWSYLFDFSTRGYPADRWINLPVWGEWRYWIRKGLWRRPFLFEETRLERVICRIKGHPNGEVYYNPMGDEPDHHCQDCGEEIG